MVGASVVENRAKQQPFVRSGNSKDALKTYLEAR